MSMDQFLAEYYGTGSGSAVEATDDGSDKTAAVAQAELFAKMAAAEGIDLNQLTDAQVEELYANTFSKEAEAEESGEDDKKEKAKEEHEEKKAEATKVAEADFLGRVMAHAYVQELNKIAEATGGEIDVTKEAAKGGNFGAFLKSVQKKGKQVGGAVKDKAEDGGKFLKKHYNKASKSVGQAADDISRGAKKNYNKASKAVGEKAEQANKFVKKHPKSVAGAAAGAGLAAGAAGGYAAGKDKEGSAIDELAAEQAVEKAAAAGWNADEAAERVAAVLILGPSEEDSKIASAEDVDQAIDIRASELLEMAGYPVSWGG